MKALQCSLTIALMLAITGCAGITVNIDYDSAVNFEEYEMFDWLPEAKTVDNPANIEQKTNIGQKTSDPQIHRWTQAAVENELMFKGYVLATEDDVDLLLVSETNIKVKEDIYLVDSFGVRFPLRYSHESQENLTEQVEWYYEVTLVLDIVDAKSNQLIWRGWATGIAYDLQKSEGTIRQAAKKMLSKFPPLPES